MPRNNWDIVNGVLDRTDTQEFPEEAPHYASAGNALTGRKTRGTIVPAEYDSATDSNHWAMPEMLKELLGEVQSTAEMAGGKRPLDENLLTKSVLDLGMMSAGAPKPGLGMFAGKLGAKNLGHKEVFDSAVRDAQEMKAAGATPEEIWKTTELHEGKDSQWRFEIPDTNTRFRARSNIEDGDVYYAKDLLPHADLYKAYAGLGELPIEIAGQNKLGNSSGYFDPTEENPIKIHGDIARYEPKEARRVMLHELQHVVQHMEGFAEGGSPDNIPWQMLPEELRGPDGKLEAYMRLAGETEARNTEDRRDLLPEYLRGIAPSLTQDRPLDQQLLWGEGPAAAIKGYHGTPYTFEPVEHNPFGEFRDSAIGSGEGVQAYGHGHYVAGNQGVADFYRRKLTDEDIPFELSYKGKENFDPLVADMARGEFLDAYGPVTSHKDLMQQLRAMQDEEWGQGDEGVKRALDWTERNKDLISFEAKKPEGSLYELALGVEPEQLLDWDRPIHEQGPIKDLLYENFIKHAPEWEQERWLNDTGGQYYDNFAQGLSKDNGAPELSKLLHEAGIPGIKYLDAGSRRFDPEQIKTNIAAVKTNIETAKRNAASASTPEFAEGYLDRVKQHEQNLQELEAELAAGPSYNYVIFDPKNLKITARNGVPLEAVEHDPWAEPQLQPVDHDPFQEEVKPQ